MTCLTCVTCAQFDRHTKFRDHRSRDKKLQSIMTILTITLTPRHLQGSLFSEDAEQPCHEFSLDREELETTLHSASSLAPCIREHLEHAACPTVEAIGLRVPFGGDRFRGPVMSSPEVLRSLANLASQSPLHLPPVLALAEGLRATYSGVPVVLVFETSFFTALPHREQAYGLDPAHMEQMGLWRYGYHGILHEAACREAASRIGLPTARIVSICLEPRPELAACVGGRPVMVTGGNTPVEGLPGERSCGDLDPSVALKLAHDLPGGLEEANRVLTRESGLLGLIGEPVTLAELLSSQREDWQLARDVFRHSVLRACGAAIAAISGLDLFVYSGRYATAGAALHPWLAPRLARATCAAIPYHVQTRTLAQLMHDIVRVELCVARV